jgi:hypothetical protein
VYVYTIFLLLRHITLAQCFFPFQVLAVRPLGLRSFISGGEFVCFFLLLLSAPLESFRFFFFTSFSIDLILLIFFFFYSIQFLSFFYFSPLVLQGQTFVIMIRYGRLLLAIHRLRSFFLNRFWWESNRGNRPCSASSFSPSTLVGIHCLSVHLVHSSPINKELGNPERRARYDVALCQVRATY